MTFLSALKRAHKVVETVVFYSLGTIFWTVAIVAVLVGVMAFAIDYLQITYPE